MFEPLFKPSVGIIVYMVGIIVAIISLSFVIFYVVHAKFFGEIGYNMRFFWEKKIFPQSFFVWVSRISGVLIASFLLYGIYLLIKTMLTYYF